MLLHLLYFWIFLFASTIVNASQSIGQFSKELQTPVEFIGDFILTGSSILGVICFFWGFIQFLEYKKNPHTATFGSVMTLVLPGIVFVFLPYLPQFLGAEVNPLQK